MTDVYDSFSADLYDAALDLSDRADEDFCLGLARDPILELGCGTGRLLLRLAEAGHEVVGLDASGAMLARLRHKLRCQPQVVRDRIELEEAELTSFSLDLHFPLILMPFPAFHRLLTVDQQLAALRRVAAHLAPGGRIVIDLLSPEALGRNDRSGSGEETTHALLDDGRPVRIVRRLVEHSPSTQLVLTELVYYVTEPNGYVLRTVERYALRCFYRFEIEHLLCREGFAVTEVWGSYDHSEYDDESQRLIVVAHHPS